MGEIDELRLNDARHDGKISELEDYVKEEVRPGLKVLTSIDASLAILSKVVTASLVLFIPAIITLSAWSISGSFEAERKQSILEHDLIDTKNMIEKLERSLSDKIDRSSRINYNGIKNYIDKEVVDGK